MTKKAKLITIITSAVVAVALIVTAICLIVANANRKKEYELREKTATSIMTCETNPSVQFVLNGNDKVMRVVALNNDGKALELNGEFIGLTAEDAAELFVKITTKAGKISLDITASGTTVTITFSGSKQDYSEMSKSVVNKVNKFFDENGIIAGAKSQIEELKESVKRLKPTASDVDTKTLDELFTQYDNIANLVSKVIPDNMASFYAKYDELNAEYLKKEARESNIYGGYCRTLKDLLIDNEFMYDFRRCFGVSSFPILNRFPTELLVSDDERMDNLKQDFHSVDECYIDQLSKEYGFWLNNAQAIIYDHDIDLKDAKDFKIIKEM